MERTAVTYFHKTLPLRYLPGFWYTFETSQNDVKNDSLLKIVNDNFLS